MHETMRRTARALVAGLLAALLPLWGAAQGGLAGLPAASGTAGTPGERARTDYAQVQLLVHAPQGVAAGRPLWLGLRIEHAPQWHTYWHNPGDSGLPIELNWTLPEGVQAGAIQWPTPRKFPLGDLANYGYDGTVLLPVPVTLPAGWQGASLPVQLHATWLICRRECVPEEATLRLELSTDGPIVQHAAEFEAAWAAAPRALPQARAELRVDEAGLHVRADGLPADWRGQTLEFFPETANLIAPGAPWTQGWDGEVWRATLPFHPYRSEAVPRLALVLACAETGHGPASAGVRLEADVQGAWPAVAEPDAPPPPAPAPAIAAGTGGPTTLGLTLALLGALAGGVILNLMPCVFPVLAIKVMAFQAHGADARAHRLGGLAYTAGVVLSFLALGALLLALRSAGEAVGWGFQLQNPWVVAGLTVLFTFIALNLAGLFELRQLAPSGLAGLQLRHPLADAFLTGVLATAVASPCTAPFMGASLGLAVTLPAPAALAVFGALGLGMALPYLAASWWPGLARRLPRPGPWMETFRQAMAFPMLAAAIWLLWVLGQQSGIHGAAALLLLLLALAWVLWALGRRARALAALGVLALLALGWSVGPAVVREAEVAATRAPASPADGAWEPWSAPRQAELLAAGRPVFVDFTAAWCVTCQVNKAAVLGDAAVLRDAEEAGIALLRADWTRRDAAITQELARLGRSGVPVYVLHVPGRAPQVLTEVLSVAEVRAAFQAARR
ncbi:protein-disulfide reductase DsbD family protein [Tepidimonas sp.]|uniref:protein-disulfide reductase DsbD family protein n=1 Tax=Tepidimonas sp. TaxID=2002775 RepID=UPI00391C63DE